MSAKIIPFRPREIDPERPPHDGVPLLLILPVVRIESDGVADDDPARRPRRPKR